MIFFGQWNIPFGVPKSSPLTVVVGTPIEAPVRTTVHQAEENSKNAIKNNDTKIFDKNDDENKSLPYGKETLT